VVPLTRHDVRASDAPLISVQLMYTAAYIRCHGSVCNGHSCFRNLTLSRSRVKLIGAGRDPEQPDWCYFLGLSGKNNQGFPVLTTASAYPMKLPAAAYSAEVATSATKAGSYGVFGEEE